jgi:hypothetical protein
MAQTMRLMWWLIDVVVAVKPMDQACGWEQKEKDAFFQ